MSRPQKIHPPIKSTFKQVIGAVADGNTPSARKAAKATALFSASKKKPHPGKP